MLGEGYVRLPSGDSVPPVIHTTYYSRTRQRRKEQEGLDRASFFFDRCNARFELPIVLLRESDGAKQGVYMLLVNID